MFQSKFTKVNNSMFATDGVLEKEAPELLPEGITQLKVIDILDLGDVTGMFGTKRKLVVVLESQEPSKKKPGENICIRATMTASLNDKSNFAQFCKSLGFDTNAVKFPVGQLKNVAFQANVITNTAKNGLKYSNLDLDGILRNTIVVPEGNVPVETI